MEKQQSSIVHVNRLRLELEKDAQRARSSPDLECMQEWVDPDIWRQNTGKTGRQLYKRYTDEELLDILRQTAVELGHRFSNWPGALRTAGLKAQRPARSRRRKVRGNLCLKAISSERNNYLK